MSLPANYKQIASNMPASGGSQGGQRLRASGGGSSSERNKDAPPLFAHNNHGNPAFTPQKSGKASASVDSRAPKPPKPPEKPIMPYMRYSKKVWDSVKAANPDLKLWEIGKKIGAMWKSASDTEKQEFIDEYESDKVKYQEALKTYHSTPEYLAWNKYKTKQRASADTDVHETPVRSSSKSQQERRIDIQPAEDEEDQDDGYSFKHVAYARFLRNHRLINEIFSDAVVPDVRSVVTTQRMQVLKRQVTSLTMHQTKLEAELQQMEEKFEAKKRKLIESSETFQEELKKHCKPAVDEETFQKMVQRQYEEMRRERQRALEEPTQLKPKSEEIKLALSTPPNHTIQSKAIISTESGPQSQSQQQQQQQQEQEPMETDPPKLATAAPILKVPTPDKPKQIQIPPAPLKEPTPTIVEPPKISKAMRKADNSEKAENLGPIVVPPIVRDAGLEKSESISQPISLPTSTPTTQSGPLSAGTTSQATHVTTPAVPETPTNTAPTPTVIPHHGPPPPHHLPPHMAPHQGIPGHPGLPHPPYGGYPPPGGPPRSPYYPPQFTGHPGQAYGQYPPYPYHQQYGPPPPSHYMARPPPGGPPLHYSDHAGAPQTPTHGPTALDSHHGPYGPPQLGSAVPPSVATPSPENEGKRDGDAPDSDKKETD